MITINIPSIGTLCIAHIVCDYNGTLAVDGKLLPGVSEAINHIVDAQVHVITADTFGQAQEQLAHTRCRLTIAPGEDQALWKRAHVESLGSQQTACIGNGRNDRLMLAACALGIVLIQGEGASVQAFNSADIVCLSIIHALAYFSNPKRLVATLRS